MILSSKRREVSRSRQLTREVTLFKCDYLSITKKCWRILVYSIICEFIEKNMIILLTVLLPLYILALRLRLLLLFSLKLWDLLASKKTLTLMRVHRQLWAETIEMVPSYSNSTLRNHKRVAFKMSPKLLDLNMDTSWNRRRWTWLRKKGKPWERNNNSLRSLRSF